MVDCEMVNEMVIKMVDGEWDDGKLWDGGWLIINEMIIEIMMNEMMVKW